MTVRANFCLLKRTRRQYSFALLCLANVDFFGDVRLMNGGRVNGKRGGDTGNVLEEQSEQKE